MTSGGINHCNPPDAPQPASIYKELLRTLYIYVQNVLLFLYTDSILTPPKICCFNEKRELPINALFMLTDKVIKVCNKQRDNRQKADKHIELYTHDTYQQ